MVSGRAGSDKVGVTNAYISETMITIDFGMNILLSCYTCEEFLAPPTSNLGRWESALPLEIAVLYIT